MKTKPRKTGKINKLLTERYNQLNNHQRAIRDKALTINSFKLGAKCAVGFLLEEAKKKATILQDYDSKIKVISLSDLRKLAKKTEY